MSINVADVKKRLHGILEDENLVNEYIRRYGPKIDIKNIKKLRESKKVAVAEEEKGGEDPIFSIMLKCPVCNFDDIPCYELRAKSQQIQFNKFMVPIYEGAMGYRTVNYSKVAVTVCPRCLFASPDKKDFMTKSTTGKPTPSQIMPNTLITLQERIGERKAMLKSVSDPVAYFKRPRSSDAAVLSYRLSLLRASIEAYFEAPFSFYKMGAYSLKIAQIFKEDGGNNEEVLKEALEYFSDAFRLSNCPSEEVEYQTIYSIIALNMRLGNLTKASSYIGVFDKLIGDIKKKMREDPKVNLVQIDKWAQRAKTLWEDRDNVDLFKGN